MLIMFLTLIRMKVVSGMRLRIRRKERRRRRRRRRNTSISR